MAFSTVGATLKAHEKRRTYIPCVSIRSNRVSCYCVAVNDDGSPLTRSASFGFSEKKSKNNYELRKGISYKASQRIRDIVNTLVDCAKWKTVYSKSENRYYRFKLNFITLTLSAEQAHTDAEIYKMVFKPFLRILRDRYKNFLYLWKAEVQDNGRIHFHLTTNTFIRHDKLRDIWNKCQEKLGYVTRSQIANPNSTDVHSTKNVKKLAAYLCGYLSKKDLYTKEGKEWHKINEKANKDQSKTQCDLPDGYFQMIKRRIEIRYWDCSRVLHDYTCRIEAPPAGVYGELQAHQQSGAQWAKYEFAEVTFLTKERLNSTRYIKEFYLSHIAKLLEMNAQDYFEES